MQHLPMPPGPVPPAAAAGETPGQAPGAGSAGNPVLERPFKLTVCYTETCNLDCRLCYADCKRAGKPAELSADEWRRILDEATREDVVALYFEGGEPFAREDFLDVLAFAAERAFTMVRTHATLIDRAKAARLARIGLGIAYVDLWGATAATHERLTGTPGSFERTLEGVRALRAEGIDTQLLIILNRLNVHEIEAYLDLAQSLEAHAVGILRLYPLGRAKRAWAELALSLDEQMAALARAKPREGLRIMQSWHPYDHNCCWHMAAANAYGEAIGCAYLREWVGFGNLTEKTLQETWEHPEHRAIRSGQVEKACPDCSASQGSHGGCRASAYAFHQRFTAPDPYDVTLNEGTDLRVLPDWHLPAG